MAAGPVWFRGPDMRILHYSAVQFTALSFIFTPDAFILALFLGACAFAYDRGVRFPAFF